VSTTAFDYETTSSYALIVRVTDNGGLTRDQSFTVNINNVNEAPTSITLSALSVQENSAAGTVIGQLGRVDPDGPGDPATYTVVGGATDRYAISVVGGVAYLVTTANPIDKETPAHNQVVVKVTDAGGLWAQQTFTINVGNVNEPVHTWSQTFSVGENQPGALLTTVGAVAMSDPDQGDSWVYTLTGNSKFSIDPNTGVIKLVQQLDYEAAQIEQFWVTVQDLGGWGYYSSALMTVNVQDFNERPGVGLGALTYEAQGWAGHELGYVPVSVYMNFNLNYSDDHLSWQNLTKQMTLTGSAPPNQNMTFTGGFISGGAGVEFNVPYSYDYSIYTARIDVWDEGGLNDFIVVNFRMGGNMGIEGYRSAPVVIDLDGDGIELVSLASSNICFDQSGDLLPDLTGWVAADDGMLVLDKDGSGRIDQASEITFSSDVDGAHTDLEGLQAYDTNSVTGSLAHRMPVSGSSEFGGI
jgi:hypothetical protein